MNLNLVKTINYIKRNGYIKAYYAVKERLEEKKKTPYNYQPISEEDRQRQIKESSSFDVKFSILVPAYETPEDYLERMIESVIGQTYAKWELIITDASSSDKVRKIVDNYGDSRVIYVKLSENEGISANSNRGLVYCKGDYTGLLDHDDELCEDALFEMAQRIMKEREDKNRIQLLFSDEDKMNATGDRFYEPNIKTKFNLDLILSNNYICHFLVIDTELMKKLAFRREFDGAQDHDLVLRCMTELLKCEGKDFARKIAYLPKVLYHWRCHENSTAGNPKSKLYAYEAGKRAVEDALLRMNISAGVRELPHVGFFYVDYKDIFSQRSNVAGVGYRLIGKKGQVCGGVYDENYSLMFEGMDMHYSGGYLHRAACQQEVPYIDPDCARLSPFAKKLYEELLLNKEEGEDYLSLKKRFCDIMKDSGFVFVYDPAHYYIKKGKRIVFK